MHNEERTDLERLEGEGGQGTHTEHPASGGQVARGTGMPRLPLRVHASRLLETEEPPRAEQGWIVVQPEDAGYEALYQEALASLRIDGSPMPYAEDAGKVGE